VKTVLVLLALTLPAFAETRTYLIAIGNNRPPVKDRDSEELEPLRFADDDAAALYELMQPMAYRATLLTVLDADSQRRFPDLASVARPPSLAELRNVVAAYKTAIEADRRAGRDAVLFLSFSGHGTRRKTPGLVLLDGALTQAVLYDEILSAIPARYVHLIVDACHAEAVVRPRDFSGQTVTLSDSAIDGYVNRTTLARFPHVGALVASSTEAQSHEWDVYQRGVFSHEVLSGLHGAADVNGDGLIEYSELYAFLSAANRDVSDPRAKLQVIAHAPPLNRRVPLIDLHRLARIRLRGATAEHGSFHIEDARGNRLLDVRPEPGFLVSLALPEGELYVRAHGEEAQLGQADVDWNRLRWRKVEIAQRGAMESAMRRGLFATAYGPTYYRGFVDRDEELIAVPLPTGETRVTTERPADRRPALALFGVSAVLGSASIAFGALAGVALADFDSTNLERRASDARDRFYAFEGATIGLGIASGVGFAIGTALWFRPKTR
jgi:hypothetical protein